MAGSKSIKRKPEEQSTRGGVAKKPSGPQELPHVAATKELDELATALKDGSALELVAEDDPNKRCLTRTALPQGVRASWFRLRIQSSLQACTCALTQGHLCIVHQSHIAGGSCQHPQVAHPVAAQQSTGGSEGVPVQARPVPVGRV